MLLRAIAVTVALLVIVSTLLDVFQTIVQARRSDHPIRIARRLYRMTWHFFCRFALRFLHGERREAWLSISPLLPFFF